MLSSHKTAHAYLRSAGPRFEVHKEKKRVGWLTTLRETNRDTLYTE